MDRILSFIHPLSHSLKTKSRHDASFAVAGGSEGYINDTRNDKVVTVMNNNMTGGHKSGLVATRDHRFGIMTFLGLQYCMQKPSNMFCVHHGHFQTPRGDRAVIHFGFQLRVRVFLLFIATICAASVNKRNSTKRVKFQANGNPHQAVQCPRDEFYVITLHLCTDIQITMWALRYLIIQWM